MYVSRLHMLASTRALTCAQCVELLMDQDTFQEASHAQMHLYDRFASDASRIKGAADPAARAATWRTGDLHLTPRDAQPLHTYGPKQIAKLLDDPQHAGKVFVDVTRLPINDKYRNRTGLPELPAEPAVTAPARFALHPVPAQKKPEQLEYRDAHGGEVLHEGAWKSTAGMSLVKQKGNNALLLLLDREMVIVAEKPAVPASPPHSMFEDSETMAMLLAAALLSDAGVYLLDQLGKRGHTGGKQNVALYSNTAVAAVRAHFRTVAGRASAAGKPLQGDAAKPLRYVERTAKVNPADKREILADANRLPKEVQHVVLVADVLADRQFKITTFYPTEQTTAQAVNVVTRPGEDLVEMAKGMYTLKSQRVDRAITLRW